MMRQAFARAAISRSGYCADLKPHASLSRMNTLAKTLLIAGVVIPVSLHVLSPEKMPWWPDTASLAIVFGVTAVVVVSRHRKEREMNRRFGMAVARLARRVLPRITYDPASGRASKRGPQA